ncbi:MAG: TRAP transporter fused permease subunit [Octadecabacter sp.]|nr:TRAP transporter fused permease subunit [Octadecabacter sp.]
MTSVISDDFLRNDDGKMRLLSWLMLGLVLFMAVSHVAQLWFLWIPSSLFKALHLCLGIVVLCVWNAQRRCHVLRSTIDLVFVCIAAVCLTYIFVSFEALIQERLFGPSQTDVVIGVLLLAAAIATSYGVWGVTIPLIAVGALLYGYFGYLFDSDLLYHSGVGFQRLVSYTSIPFFEGLLGSMTGLSGGLIFVFMLFAGLLRTTGGIDFILTLAERLGGRTVGGPAKVAVVGSGIMGMISGSTVANVASTGSITIPLMKKNGFKGSYAGAVEAVASTGGQFMPPVMGLTAFLIVGITGVPYGTVMMAALMPALIFYGNLFLAVHFQAVSSGMKPQADDGVARPSLMGDFKEYGHLVVAVILLVYLLVGRMPPGHAAVIAALFIIASEIVKQVLLNRLAPFTGLRIALRRILAGLHEGVVNGAQLAVVIAVIGVLVDMMTITGFAQKLSNLMLGVADDSMIILLCLAALSCLVFGLGMPTPAAYSLVAVVGAPALVDFGVELLTAHMFVFFFANMSAVTPPVALAALVASKLAKDSYARTAFTASVLGLPGFMIPFLFIVYPEILMLEGTLLTRALAFGSIFAGFVALNVALSGTMLTANLPPLYRLGALIAAGLLLWPSVLASAIGLALFLILLWLDRARRVPQVAS